jgi:hypothetical protein
MVEKALGVEGDDVLYVGDHIYTDAALAKINFRWRTALVIRELELEIDALARGRPHRDALKVGKEGEEGEGALCGGRASRLLLRPWPLVQPTGADDQEGAYRGRV